VRVGEFLSKLLDLARPLEPLDMPLLDAHGATLASDIYDEDRIVLQSGIRIRATQIGLAAQLGLNHLPTRPQPRVVILALGKGSDPEINSWLLTTAAREAGALGFRLFSHASTQGQIKAVIEDQLIRADLLLIVGDGDSRSFQELGEILQRIGEIEKISINIQSSPDVIYGVVGPEKVPMVLLPSIPILAYISSEIFARPMIRKMMGLLDIHRPTVKANLTKDLVSTVDENEFFLAVLEKIDGKNFVTPLEEQESMVSLSQANALLVISAEAQSAVKDSLVEVVMLERRYL
jgi:molybdopterin biosynthesis enzyme